MSKELRQQVIAAYCRIRKEDHVIPDDVLDFMYNSAMEKLDPNNALEASEKRVKEFELLVANLIPLFESGYIANHSAKADKDRERLLKIMKEITSP